MKKIFTTLLLTLCAFICLNAQKFEFRMNGDPVVDGETVTFYGKKHVIKPQYEYKTTGILSLHNLTDNDINYSVEVEVLENTMEAFDMQICMGGLLYIFEGNTLGYMAKNALPASGSTPTLFDAASILTTGYMLTKLTVTDGLESQSVIIRFEYSTPVKIDNLWYSLDPTLKSATVVKDNEDGYSGDIVIPSNVDYNGTNYVVKDIANEAFFECKELTKVTLPQTITRIGRSAFKNCVNLESITFPATLKTIEYETFYGCSALNNINLPEGLEVIESHAFSNCI